MKENTTYTIEGIGATIDEIKKMVADFIERQESKELQYFNTKEAAEIMRCSISTARDVMNRNDFPLNMMGKNMRVSNVALAEWSKGRRV